MTWAKEGSNIIYSINKDDEHQYLAQRVLARTKYPSVSDWWKYIKTNIIYINKELPLID